MNLSYCKYGFLCKQWYLAKLNLEKTIFKPEDKTIYGTNDHLWHLKLVGTVSKNWKNSAIEEDEKSASCRMQREGQRDNNILFNNLWVSDIFVLLPAIVMQYFYDSV